MRLSSMIMACFFKRKKWPIVVEWDDDNHAVLAVSGLPSLITSFLSKNKHTLFLLPLIRLEDRIVVITNSDIAILNTMDSLMLAYYVVNVDYYINNDVLYIPLTDYAATLITSLSENGYNAYVQIHLMGG